MRNVVPRRYREVAVAEVDGPLTSEWLGRHFLGREAYRRTRYIAAICGEDAALLRVHRESGEPLFSPITDVEVLATPAECALVRAPDVDTGVPTQMARVAEQLAPGARCVIVTGRHEHVSFIVDPAPLPIRVVDVVPPEPAKLVDQAQRVLDIADDLPPVRLVPDLLNLENLKGQTGDDYLLPCRGSGVDVDGARVSYLDQRPEWRPWVLIGCTRSQEIHRWFYGEPADMIDICPRRRTTTGDEPVLTKCCLIEEHVEVRGRSVCVPWGATLELVREGLNEAISLMEPEWEPA